MLGEYRLMDTTNTAHTLFVEAVSAKAGVVSRKRVLFFISNI